jgi:hypothetical protein
MTRPLLTTRAVVVAVVVAVAVAAPHRLDHLTRPSSQPLVLIISVII